MDALRKLRVFGYQDCVYSVMNETFALGSRFYIKFKGSKIQKS